MLSFLKKSKSIEIFAPIDGIMKCIEEVKDPVFAQKMMGEGIAIEYQGGDVYAPISGVLSIVFLPSMHAFGIRSDEGVELLVHVGLETVNLKGEGFTSLKKQGDRVKCGDKILSVDYGFLKAKGVDLITPIVLTNSDQFECSVQVKTECKVSHGDLVCSLKKK